MAKKKTIKEELNEIDFSVKYGEEVVEAKNADILGGFNDLASKMKYPFTKAVLEVKMGDKVEKLDLAPVMARIFRSNLTKRKLLTKQFKRLLGIPFDPSE